VKIAGFWDALQAEGRTEPGWHLRRVDAGSSCDLFAGLRQPGATPGLLLEVPIEMVPSDLQFPESRGFAVEPQLIGHSHAGAARFTLWLRDTAYTAIFPVLCENVADAAIAETLPGNALRAWVGRLIAWQEFMTRHGPDGLTDEAAIGLLGELLILQEELAPRIGLDAAIRCWAGPRGEPNDFELARGFLEVKTTSRQASHSLQITSLDQLDNSRGRILLLHQRMRRDPAGVSLPEAVKVLKERVAAEAPLGTRDLEGLLLQAEYIDAHASRYGTRFARGQLALFAVEDEFPRITRADVRHGVRDCTYVIDLALCLPLPTPELALGDKAAPMA
jgi:hypothetical protein